jgi:nucleotide-binding universal stress UspA family protein
MLPIQTILHPTDFSEHSEAAFRLASEFARDYRAHLVVLHVLSKQTLAYGEILSAPEEDQYRVNALDALHKIQPGNRTISIEHHLVEGDPATAIIQAARQFAADLIVMGMHGRTGLSRLLMGSVAEQVVRRAPCPVLTTKFPFPEAALAVQDTVAAMRHDFVE